MKVSVITPSFNQGRYLRDSLESVFTQIPSSAGCDLEHIVIDAGSTDETLSILAEWQSKNTAPGYSFEFVSEPDDGMTDAINKGFRRATGDWLMWLNTDDYLLPGAIAKVLEFAARSPDADVLYGDCLFVDENKDLLREKREGAFDFSMLLFYGCYIQSTACFYRRSLLDRGLFLDASYKITMDFEYYLRLAQSGAVFRHVPEILAGFRWHGGNMSARQAALRRNERFRAQCAALARAGHPWLAQKWILRILFRYQQLLRGCRGLQSRLCIARLSP